MKLDTDVPFGALCQSRDQLKAAILDISLLAIPHHRDHDFLDSLHFLAPYQPGEATPPPEQKSSSSRDHCPCKTAPKFSHSGPQTLRLAKIHECTHYLAVSYCWHRGEVASEDAADKFRIRTAEGKERLAWAPTAILRRAIEYAIHYNIPYIWIDQDCIEQNDREGKIAGIQSLDLVYRRAEYSVGLLRETLRSQRHIDALLAIREVQRTVTAPDASLPEVDWEAICELLEHLATDEWFTRSWILQEYALAKDMRLLVKCPPDLNFSTMVQVGQGQVELPPKDFELEDIGHQYIAGGKSDRLSFDRLLQAIGSTNARPVCQPLGTFGGEEERFGTNASKALWYLRKRKNTRVQDRITIIGNLCDNALRLDTRQRDLESHSFSVALLTLALLNGDFSLLFSEPDKSMAPKFSDSWLPSPSTAFDQVRGLGDLGDTIRFATFGISARGLGCKGFITHINTQIDMAKIQMLYCTEYQHLGAYGNRRNSRTRQELDIIVLSEVTLTFEGQGCHILADLLRTWIHSIGNSASQSTIKVVNGLPDAHSRARRLPWLIDRVMNQSSLWCGIFGKDPSTGEPTAIFDASEPELVFTPYSESFKSRPRSKLLDLPISWVIDPSQLSPSGGTDSSSSGWQIREKAPINCVRRACGIFQTSSAIPESLTLAWPPYNA